MERDSGPFHVEHSGYFVTGTDTGVGKTFVAAALARRARSVAGEAGSAAASKRTEGERHPVFAFKPVETGCTQDLGEDQRALWEAAGAWQSGGLRGLYQFGLPAAPRVAAEAESRTISLDAILDCVREGRRLAQLTIVEGAGGWRVPITSDVDMSDLARALNLPVVVVARAGLGTINHSLLTVEAVERDGCAVAALIVSRRPEDDRAFAESNAHEIRRVWSGRLLLLDEDPGVLDVLLR